MDEESVGFVVLGFNSCFVVRRVVDSRVIVFRFLFFYGRVWLEGGWRYGYRVFIFFCRVRVVLKGFGGVFFLFSSVCLVFSVILRVV